LRQKISQEILNGKAFVISSHVLSELDEMVTDVVYMQDGQVLFQKSVEELMAETQENKLSKMISKIIAY
ncbi:MAG: ABC transporter ATP-binding protein, partial [Bacteroidota bacterium]